MPDIIPGAALRLSQLIGPELFQRGVERWPATGAVTNDLECGVLQRNAGQRSSELERASQSSWPAASVA
jgi:hypothetical protein